MALSYENWKRLYQNKHHKSYILSNTNYKAFTDNELLYEFNPPESTNETNDIGFKHPIEIFDDAYTLYQQVTKIPTFTSLDLLLQEPFLLSGALTLVHTSDKAGRGFIIQLFISLMLKYYEQGVIFIDCTNIFPAYEIIEATIEKKPLIDPQLPIRAVQLSRSFNYHQTTETIKEQLEPLLRDGFTYNTTNEFSQIQETKFVKPKIIIVAGLPDLYLNAESAQYLEYDNRPSWWSILELQEAIGHLRSLTMKYNCVTVISASSDPLSKVKSLGGKYINQSSTVIIKLKTEGLALYGELIKHPFKANNELLLQILKKKGKKRATMPLKYYL